MIETRREQMYRIEGKAIVHVFNLSMPYEELTITAYCDNPKEALAVLREAQRLNDNRKYTASARTYARLEQMPGFRWSNEVLETH